MLTALFVMLLFGPAGWDVQPPDVSPAAVLGLEGGMPLSEARTRLSRLGTPDSRETRDGGTKEVWRLESTGFSWIALRADRGGRLVWVTGHRREGHELPFDALGVEPQLATGDTAVWHVQGRLTQQRLTLRGSGRAARVVTLSVVP